MKRLFIDLEKCNKCRECPVTCSYFHRDSNQGVVALREFATYALICRQCEEGGCILACPKEALEKQADGVLKRYNMRCVSCKSCTYGCPFGTILPEILPYKVSQCDHCADISGDRKPACVDACPEGAIKFAEIEENPKEHIYLIGNTLAVKAVSWKRKVDNENKVGKK